MPFLYIDGAAYTLDRGKENGYQNIDTLIFWYQGLPSCFIVNYVLLITDYINQTIMCGCKTNRPTDKHIQKSCNNVIFTQDMSNAYKFHENIQRSHCPRKSNLHFILCFALACEPSPSILFCQTLDIFSCVPKNCVRIEDIFRRIDRSLFCYIA